MKQAKLGASGVTVSRLGLGTMTWGGVTTPEDAAEQLKAFLDAGGNLLDTADIYAGGQAEEILGELLAKAVNRADVVLTTKAVGVLDGPRPRPDASRRHLLQALDESLKRLRTDYVDLWQMHAWDPKVPLEETMEAIDYAISSGRVRQAGICNYSGWQTMKAAMLRQRSGNAPLASLQVEYSLLERGIEREVIPAAEDQGLGVLSWASLGRGVLTGKYSHGVPEKRANSRAFQAYVGHHLDDRSAKIVTAVAAAAAAVGVSSVAVSLGWLWARPTVVASLVGARNLDQLRDSLIAAQQDVLLPEEIIDQLEEVSRPFRGYPETGV
jgi:aryl-alcohol dehydrogenase-like predicted oxidoreductase